MNSNASVILWVLTALSIIFSANMSYFQMKNEKLLVAVKLNQEVNKGKWMTLSTMVMVMNAFVQTVLWFLFSLEIGDWRFFVIAIAPLIVGQFFTMKVRRTARKGKRILVRKGQLLHPTSTVNVPTFDRPPAPPTA